jgi:hypothetical protein
VRSLYPPLVHSSESESLRVRLVAGQPGQGRLLASSLVPPILRDNWGQHMDSPVLTLDPEPNNLI